MTYSFKISISRALTDILLKTVAVGVIKSVVKAEKSGGKVTKAAQKATGKK